MNELYNWMSNYGSPAPQSNGLPDWFSNNMGQQPQFSGMPIGNGQGMLHGPETSFLSNYTPNISQASGDTNGGFLSGMIGTREAPGWGGMALGGASAIMNGIMAMKQYGLAKDTLAANKEQFNKNYAAQATTTNTALEDRQRARIASNPGAYQSLASYMQQNSIKG